MKSKAGLWIDHRKCLIVFVNGKKIGIKIIKSNLNVQPTPSSESQNLKDDNQKNKHFAEKLNLYFNEIISIVKDARSIFIFGPGMAKNKLLKRITKLETKGYIEDLETTDNMTGAQVVAKVRHHYCT
jgi:stalled ribosome rescue protein Dom34